MSHIDPYKQADQLFGLDSNQLERVMGTLIGKRNLGLHGDLYGQRKVIESLSFAQGGLKSASVDELKGIGVRVVQGDKVGYVPCQRTSMTQLIKSARKARRILKYGTKSEGLAPGLTMDEPAPLYIPGAQSTQAANLEPKIRLLESIDLECRKYDARIVNVMISMTVEEDDIFIATSQEDMLADSRPLTKLSINCIAADGAGRIESGNAGAGGRCDVEFFFKDDRWKKMAAEAAKNAVDMLSSVPAKAGEMDVVLGAGWSGVLLHEAIGHGLEGDFIRRGTSAFSKLLGEMVASPECTVVDDGALPGQRGSLNFDDEGKPTQKTVLIEKGKLVGFLQDQTNSKLMGVAATGNGRRQDYRYEPMPRMTNTFLAPGNHTPEEIVRSVKRGLYISTFAGGQVNITNGKFVFFANGAYEIENGKLGRMVKGATLIGDGPSALKKITMVGNEKDVLDPGVGTCGKSGQGVPVCVGMPTARLNGITVGGMEV